MPGSGIKRAWPENPAASGLIGVETETAGENPGTGSTLVPTSARRSIVVPATGLAERYVLEALGLTFERVRPMYGDELGCPRDYGYLGASTVFTPAGVRRLAALCGIEVDVLDHEPVGASELAASGDPHKHRAPWWQRDLEDGS